MTTKEYFTLVNQIQKNLKIDYATRYSDKRQKTGYRTKWWLTCDTTKYVDQINYLYGHLVTAKVHEDRYKSLVIHPNEKISDVPKKRTWVFKEVPRKWVLI